MHITRERVLPSKERPQRAFSLFFKGHAPIYYDLYEGLARKAAVKNKWKLCVRHPVASSISPGLYPTRSLVQEVVLGIKIHILLTAEFEGRGREELKPKIKEWHGFHMSEEKVV